jgi:DNA repair exonuclease SbcCD ATPase subunit
MATDASIRVGVDGEKEFSSALKAIDSQIKNLRSEMKSAVTSMSGLDSAETRAAKQSDILGRSLEAQKQKLSVLNGQYDRQSAKLKELAQAAEDAANAQYSSQDEMVMAVTKANNAYNRQNKVVNDLGTQINNTTAEINRLQAEMGGVSTETTQAVSAFDRLSQKISQQEGDLKGLKQAYSNAVLEFGDGSSEAKQFASQIERLSTELKQSRSAMQDAADAADKLDRSLDDAGNEAKEASSAFGDVFSADMLSDGIQSVVSGIADLVESTSEYRRIMASLEVSSQKAGYTAEQTAQSYQQFYSVLGDEQSSATALSNLQALGLSQEDLTKMIDGTIGAWATYGDSIPIDSLAESVNETIRVSKATGTFSDVLNWAGTSEDEFNAALESANSETERANLVLKELSRQGLVSAAEEWRNTNSAIVETNKASSDLNDALARAGDALSPMVAKVKEFAANLVNGFLDVAESSDIAIPAITGVATAIGVLAAASVVSKIGQLVSSLGLLATLTNPFVLLGAAAAGVAAAIVTLCNSEGEYVDYSEQFATRIQETTDQVNAHADAYDNLLESAGASIETMQTEMGLVEQYVTELEKITDANGKVKEGYEERAAYLADYINSKVPGAVEASGEEADAVYKVSDAIEELIWQRQKEATLNALQPAYEEALLNQRQALTDYTQAMRDHNVAQERVNKLQEVLNQTTSATDYSRVNHELMEAKDALNQTSETLRTAESTWKDQNNVMEAYNEAASATIGETDKLNHALAITSDTLVQSTGDNSQAILDNIAKIQSDYQYMVTLAAESWDSMSETQRQGILNAIDQQRGLLDEQVNIARESGIQIPAEMGVGMNEGAYQLTGATQQLYLQLMQELMPGVDVTQIGDAWDFMLSNGLISSSGQVNMAAAAVADGAEAAMQMEISDGETTQSGVIGGTGFGDGLGSTAPYVNEKAAGIVNGGKATMDSAVSSAGFPDPGQDSGYGYASGLDASQPTVEKSWVNLIFGGKSAAYSAVGSADFPGVGAEGTNEVASGVDSTVDVVNNALIEMINTARSIGYQMVRDFTVIGYAINDAIAGAINVYALDDKLRRMARNALAAARSELRINSPSKEFRDKVGKPITEGVVVGVDSTANDAVKSVKNMARSVANAATIKKVQSQFEYGASLVTRPSPNTPSALLQAATAAVPRGVATREVYQVEIPLVINGKELYRATFNDLRAALNGNARRTAKSSLI